jgi:hypothetical protein
MFSLLYSGILRIRIKKFHYPNFAEVRLGLALPGKPGKDNGDFSERL